MVCCFIFLSLLSSKVGEHDLAAPVCHGYGKRRMESVVVVVFQDRIAISLLWDRQCGGDLSQEKFQISGKVVYFFISSSKNQLPGGQLFIPLNCIKALTSINCVKA